MRIAHVVDSMEVGGAETLVSQMCRAQREHGHEPIVYALASLGPLGAQLRNEGFLVEADVARHLHRAIPAFLQLFRKSRPDVIHLHNPTPTIYAAFAGRMAGVRNIVSTRHSLVAPPHRRGVELKYGIAAKCCDWIVGICDATASNLRSLKTIPARKIVRVYNGVTPVGCVPVEKRPAKSGFTLLFVGRLAPVKNLTLLLRAFHSSLASRPDLRLWIVGDGSERTALEGVARELDITRKVKFWGEQLDVEPFFSAADMFIMSSISEGLPLSLLQAFSAGLSAIVTDVGGMAEVVRLADAGLTVLPGAMDRMAAAILELSGDHSRRARFSVNARSAFAANFDLSRTISEYERLYGSRNLRATSHDAARRQPDGSRA